MSDSVEKNSSAGLSKTDQKKAEVRRMLKSESGQKLINQDLDFTFRDSSNITDKVQSVNYPFSQNVYSAGGSMICTSNSGANMVHGPSSYLVFDLNGSVPNGTMGLGTSGYLALFNSILIQTSDGTDLVREVDVANKKNYEIRAKHSLDWIKAYGSVMGYRGGFLKKGTQEITETDQINYANGDTYRVIIPLGLFTDFFNQDKLIPPRLTQGLRCTLGLNSATEAFVGTSADPGETFTITNARLVFREHNLMDFAQSFLIRQSSLAGLSYVYESFLHSGNLNSSDFSLSLSVSDALAKTVNSVVKPRLASNINNRATDSFASAPSASITEFRANMGGYSEPNTALSMVNSQEEGYHYVQENLWKQASEGELKPNSISYTDYKTEGMYHIGISLVRSDNLSGLQIASSKQLQWNLKTNSAANHYDVHTTYVKVVESFLTNEVVYD